MARACSKHQVPVSPVTNSLAHSVGVVAGVCQGNSAMLLWWQCAWIVVVFQSASFSSITMMSTHILLWIHLRGEISIVMKKWHLQHLCTAGFFIRMQIVMKKWYLQHLCTASFFIRMNSHLRRGGLMYSHLSFNWLLQMLL